MINLVQIYLITVLGHSKSLASYPGSARSHCGWLWGDFSGHTSLQRYCHRCPGKKLPSILLDEPYIHKIENLSGGISHNFQAVLLRARKDIEIYHSRYRDRITPFMVCRQITNLFQEYMHSVVCVPLGLA